MPVMGYDVIKQLDSGAKVRNRYYALTDDFAEAQTFANQLTAMERHVFSAQVLFLKVHVWIPNSNPNQKRNFDQSGPGTIANAIPTPEEWCLRVFFETSSSDNPHYKDYRVQAPITFITGKEWNSFYTDPMADFYAARENNEIPLCTRQGELLGSVTFQLRIANRQMSKAWYNRVTP